MSSQNAKRKSKYVVPTLAPLGEMGKGAGENCRAGSNADPGDCTSVGTTAQAYCAAGTTAQTLYCTAGTSAQTACTGGNTAVTEACTAGIVPGI